MRASAPTLLPGQIAVNHSRFLSAAFGTALFATAFAAHAQTTIKLNTATGTCVAVTNAAGLNTESTPGSTTLRADGVSLTAQQQGACNPVGGSSSTFNATVSTSGSQTPGTPYTPAINAPFYVLWSASQDATACTYGGNFTSGMTGWTVGARACVDGNSCSAAHAIQVTPTAAGNYNFSVTCTNASGYAATSTLNVPQPATPAPTPNPIPLTAPSSAGAGSAVSITWPQMANAATCTGTGTLDGVDVPVLGDWSALTAVSNSAANARNVTIPATAVVGSQLKLTLTCWNADHSASAIGTSANIGVTVAVAGCPATITTADGTRTLLTSSGVSYGVYPTQRPNVNLTEWDNIWGYNNTTATQPVAWPGVGGASPVIRNFQRDSYIGAHFRTGASTSVTGHFSNPSFAAGPNQTMAISTECGDFSAHLPTPGCLIQNVPTADANLLAWKLTSNNPTGSCNLLPNTDYYVNMMITDHLSTVECNATATTCNISAVSYHN